MNNVDTFKNVNPYRATKLWNELITAFKNGVPVRNNRYRMRTYENTFMASEAVDWLLRYLRNHDEFGPDISRIQAIQLLQKFTKSRIIEDVRKKNAEFQDGKKLYHIVTTVTQSPWKIHPRTPLRAVQNHTRDNSLVLKQNNLMKSKESSEPAFKMNFNPKYKFSNDIPRPSSAVMEGNALCLPSMPITLSAKEVIDVWKSIMWNRLELILGVTTLQNVLNPADVCGKTIRHNSTKIDKNGIVSVVDKSENLPEWILCAMKCLARWPNASGSGSCLPKYSGFENDVFKVVKDHFCNMESPLIPFNLFRLFYGAYMCIAKGRPNATYKEINQSVPNEDCKRTSFWEENTVQSEICFETDFIEATPVTRVFTSSCSSDQQPKRSGSSATISRNENISRRRDSKFTRTRRCVSMECVNGRSNLMEQRLKGSTGNLQSDGSSSNLTSCLSEESLISDVAGKRVAEVANNSLVLSAQAFVPQTLPSFYRELNDACQERLLKFMQLALLLLPTGLRKQLHLLLRLLKKICDNKDLVLFPPGCTQFMLVKTFANSIIRAKVISGQEDDAVFSSKISDFLLDHCQEVLSPPKELIIDVGTIIKQHATAKYGCYSRCQSEPVITYCQQISKEAYEQQKTESSLQAVGELLDSIINNQKLTEKEKQKKLKLFQLQYPDIYERRFPSKSWYETEAAINELKSREGKTLLEKFFKLRL